MRRQTDSQARSFAVAAPMAAVACSLAALLMACSRGKAGPPTPAPASVSASRMFLPPDLKLPTSSATTAPNPDAVQVLLTPQRLALWPEGRTLAVPPPDVARYGFEARAKGDSRSNYLLKTLSSEMSSRHPESGPPPDMLVAFDVTTPYRAMAEVLFTLSRGYVGGLSLLVEEGPKQAAIPIAAPIVVTMGKDVCYALQQQGEYRVFRERVKAAVEAGADASAAEWEVLATSPVPVTSLPAFLTDLAKQPPRLCLKVTVVETGFVLSAFGQTIAEGCHDAGTGIAVPRSNGAYDFNKLSECAGRLKREVPEAASETEVTISASYGVQAQVIVAAIDALHGVGDAGGLFPAVHFALPW